MYKYTYVHMHVHTYVHICFDGKIIFAKDVLNSNNFVVLYVQAWYRTRKYYKATF